MVTCCAAPTLYLGGFSEVSPERADAKGIGLACICKAMLWEDVPHLGSNITFPNFDMFDVSLKGYQEMERNPGKLHKFVWGVMGVFGEVDTHANSRKAIEKGKCNIMLLCKRGRHRSEAALAAHIAWNNPGARCNTIMDFICKQRPAVEFSSGPITTANGKKYPGMGPLVEHLVNAFRTMRAHGKVRLTEGLKQS